MSVACRGEFCNQGSGSVQGRRLTDTVRRLRSTATARWSEERAFGPFVAAGHGSVAPRPFSPATPGVVDAGVFSASDAWCATPNWPGTVVGVLRPAISDLPSRRTRSRPAPIDSIATGRGTARPASAARHPLEGPAPRSPFRTDVRDRGTPVVLVGFLCSPSSPSGDSPVVSESPIARTKWFVSPVCTAAGKACDEKRNVDERPPAGGKPDRAR
jgi:hypothetical protein